MKLYYMKKDAIEKLKSNLKFVYENYYSQETNDWLWKVCEDNPFEVYKEIDDFELYSLGDRKNLGEVEFNNCKILYENLKFLTNSQATSEQLWAGLCHTVFYDYLRKRWSYDSKQPKSAKDACKEILSRFFVNANSRSSLYRNSLSKCWWTGYHTYDEHDSINKFRKLDIIGSSDISTKINDIFYNYKFSSNDSILEGIIIGLDYFNNEGYKISVRNHLRPTLQYLNAVGGALLLDALDENEIGEIFMDKMDSLIHGESQGIEVVEHLDDDEDLNKMVEEIDEEEYVKIGNVVVVTKSPGNIESRIIVNYINGSNVIPELAKLLLDKHKDDCVEFEGITYKIKEIISNNKE